MTNINEELKTLIKNTSVYDINLADAVYEEFGAEIGTKENLDLMKEQLEIRIEQIQDALNILDDEKHVIPIFILKNIYEELVIPSLKNIQKRLDEGDYRHD
jgi:hypothetical protein